jgi:hypothetical protein
VVGGVITGLEVLAQRNDVRGPTGIAHYCRVQRKPRKTSNNTSVSHKQPPPQSRQQNNQATCNNCGTSQSGQPPNGYVATTGSKHLIKHNPANSNSLRQSVADASKVFTETNLARVNNGGCTNVTAA